MKNSVIIENILDCPVQFEKQGNKSIISLLKKTGYFEIYNEINEADILQVLNKKLQYVDVWLTWSSNQRYSSGWYFTQNKTGKYIVSYYPNPENLKFNEYSDGAKACADYVKKFIESIRKYS